MLNLVVKMILREDIDPIKRFLRDVGEGIRCGAAVVPVGRYEVSKRSSGSSADVSFACVLLGMKDVATFFKNDLKGAFKEAFEHAVREKVVGFERVNNIIVVYETKHERKGKFLSNYLRENASSEVPDEYHYVFGKILNYDEEDIRFFYKTVIFENISDEEFDERWKNIKRWGNEMLHHI